MTKKKVTTPVEEIKPTEPPVAETVVTEVEVNTPTEVEVNHDVIEKSEPETKTETKPDVVEESKSKIKAGVITVTEEEAQSDEFRKYGIRSKGIWRIREKKDGFRVEHLST